jgi:para-aminobenzoate synthetase/4-amino-4-deoxychorismate lyase
MHKPFDLLETLLWKPDEGYRLLDRHLQRLLQSADYFGFRLDRSEVQVALDRFTATLAPGPQRVRLTVSRRGETNLSAVPVDVDAGFPPIVLAENPVDSRNPFLYHKTTNREVYERALAQRPGFEDVLLFNERGEITESTIANVVVSVGGELVTPPVRCGLLPGTLRAHLLDEKRVRERVITIRDLLAADTRYLINSVRGFRSVSVVTEP